MIRRILILITTGFVFLMFACNRTPMQAFSGKTIDLSDNTMIYLSKRLNDEIIDSAQIANNSFNFDLKPLDHPMQVVLHTKDEKQRKTFWLDKGDVTYIQNTSDFRDVTILGSETETINQTHRNNYSGLGYEQRLEKNFEFINNNPNHILSAFILSVYNTTWGKDKTSQLFNGLSEELRLTDYGIKVQQYLDLSQEHKIGDNYTDLSIPNILGNETTLSGSRSKITLLEFWASWCGPCRQENPELVKTYEMYNSKGFEIYAVSLDKDKQSWIDAIKEDALKWLHVSELIGHDCEAVLIYNVNGIPDNFLIDENGKIVGKGLRGSELQTRLAELMDN